MSDEGAALLALASIVLIAVLVLQIVAAVKDAL